MNDHMNEIIGSVARIVEKGRMLKVDDPWFTCKWGWIGDSNVASRKPHANFLIYNSRE